MEGVLGKITLRHLIGTIAVVAAIGSIVNVEKEYFLPLLSGVFLALISFTDTLWTKIPNIITFPTALLGLAYHTVQAGAAGFFTSLLGLALGLGLLLVPFALGGMGAGDVKALGALGALIGPSAVFNVFFYMALIGGGMAILHYACNRNLLRSLAQSWQAVLVFAGTRDKDCLAPSPQSESLRFPYAAAIALGYFTFVIRGGIV